MAMTDALGIRDDGDGYTDDLATFVEAGSTTVTGVDRRVHLQHPHQHEDGGKERASHIVSTTSVAHLVCHILHDTPQQHEPARVGRSAGAARSA